ncbi:hypothetical protein INT47_012004 [Mucor saturninus]|uniref:Uncharacterized protein n=1 Tax=Mucor saturninus TaxID=64648 RepID=A0A8H7R5Q2_9FUNG|nr:hypothetical protein INT47_012004 [Mucor saturninus]
MVTRAERRINAEAAKIEHLIARKKKERTGFERWIDFVNKTLTLSLQTSEETSKEKILELNHKEPPLRTRSSSLSPLLRSDLPLDIKQEFLDRILDATISATDYIYEYSLQMLKSSDILTEVYHEEFSEIFLPPPLDHNLFSMFNNSIGADLQKNETEKTFTKSENNYKGMGKAENCTITLDLLNSGKIAFSGTDDGLISMTDTVSASLDRFKFHLQLYNKFSALTEDAHAKESQLDLLEIKLPKNYRIYAKDGSGNKS